MYHLFFFNTLTERWVYYATVENKPPAKFDHLENCDWLAW